MTIPLLKAAGMIVLLVGFVGMLRVDRPHSRRTAGIFKLTEYWGFGYVALYATNWWPGASRMSLSELLPAFILLPCAYGMAWWIVGMIVKEANRKGFW